MLSKPLIIIIMFLLVRLQHILELFIAKKITILQYDWIVISMTPHIYKINMLRRVGQCAPRRFDSTWLLYWKLIVFLQIAQTIKKNSPTNIKWKNYISKHKNITCIAKRVSSTTVAHPGSMS